MQHLWNSRSDRSGRPQVKLVPILVTVLWLQGCLLAGLHLSPLLAGMKRRPESELAERTIQWRRANYRRERDPAVGAAAPAITLRSPAGNALRGEALRGGPVALVFVPDGSG